ncbi:MAG: hypothetical protein ABIG03_01180 [Candidatus Eisenbacteria bacterium]
MRARTLTRTLLVLALAATVVTNVGCSEAGAGPAAVVGADAGRGETLEITIQISPSTLVLDSAGTWVTIHADIPYSRVDTATLMFDGLAPASTKADACGDLVVKLHRDDVVAAVAPPEAVLTLSGSTVDAVPFHGTDTIAVQ